MKRVLVVALYLGVVAAAYVSVKWGRQLQREAPEVFLGAAPLVGRNFRDGWDWRFGWGLVGAGAVAVTVMFAVYSEWLWRVRLRFVVAVTGLAAGTFSALLALTDGRDGLYFGVEDETEYLANVGRAGSISNLVNNFVDRIDGYSVHVRGHPPGYLVGLEVLDRVGLGGSTPVVVLTAISTVVLPMAVLTAVWALAGPRWVRRAAPFLIVAPYSIWMMTSADATFSALGATGVALVALGVRFDSWVCWVAGVAGGMSLSGLLFMTYGAALYLLIPLAVVVAGLFATQPSRRRSAIITATGAVCAALVVTALWAWAGFWWFDGATATQREYWDGSAQFRIWNYFIFANLVVAVIAVGPAGFVGLTRLKNRRMWVVVGASLAALLAANLSQLSKGETERIWLLFYPWIVLAGGALVGDRGGAPCAAGRRVGSMSAMWVGLEATAAIALQAALVTKW